MFRRLCALLLIYSIHSQLYRTDRSLYIKTDYHTCFYYDLKDSSKSRNYDLKSDQSVIIPFCIRDSLFDDREQKEKCNGKIYTFDYMYRHNWTSSKLIDMKAPYDIIDNYQNYLDSNQLRNQHLYYCYCENIQFFGQQCQYTFKSRYNWAYFPGNLGQYYNSRKDISIDLMNEITNGTCYEGINCITNSLCLQWNEICDGKRDCLDGKDEENCSIFELIECNTEYRCLNGFNCIPKEFSFDFSSDCIDGTDEQYNADCDYNSFPFECPDIHCGWESFSCGNGECIEFQFNSNDPDDEHCHSQRDWYYIQNLLIKSELINEICWKSVLCLFEFDHYFPSQIKKCVNQLNQCPQSIRFPFMKYLYLDYYVYLIYKRERLINNPDVFINPDYVCFDGKQCLTLCSMNEIIVDGEHTCCRFKSQFNFQIDEWSDLYKYINRVLNRNCSSIYHPHLNFNQTNNCSKSLFHCLGTQKCISRHRVFDGIPNCYNSSDEDEQINSCELDIPNRFQCSESKHQCIPRYFLLNDDFDCLDQSDEKFPEKCSYNLQTTYACAFIRGTTTLSIHDYVFKDLCNGSIEHQYENETDETDCYLWPCASPSTMCNHKWNCYNGLDEVNCHPKDDVNWIMRNYCQLNEHICIDVFTRNWSCLPLNLAGDQHIDCIGGIDEQYNNSCTQEKDDRFQCFNSTKCISPDKLCNGINDCPFGDDEQMICPWINKNSSNCKLKSNFLCQDGRCLSRKVQCNRRLECIDNEDEWFCFINKNLPATKDIFIISQLRQSLSKLDDANHAWFCNFGLPIYSIDRKIIKKCLCPPSFYGKRCEYQSNRIILIHRIDIPQYFENQVMKFVFYLYNLNTTQILDHDEIVHFTIRTTFLPIKYFITLVYPRQENENRHKGMIYGVRINAYFVTNIDIKFQCAWLFVIPIYTNILPVQRIVSRLIFDLNRFHFQCSSKQFCNSNGLCKQYMNNPDLFYCYCYQQWFGDQCQYRIPINSSSICSKESLIIYDSIQTKSLCICPLSKIGPTCRVPYPYNRCQNNSLICLNNGICSLVDARQSVESSICLCTEEYGGIACNKKAFQIVLTLSSSLSSNKDVAAIIYYLARFLSQVQTVKTLQQFSTEEEEISFKLYIHATKLITMNFKFIPTIYIRPEYWIDELPHGEKHYLSVIKVVFNNFTEEIYYYNHNYINASLRKIDFLIGYERCLSIKELFNSTILKSHPLKRLKYYHQPCIHQLTKCFYDDVYLCFCNARYNFSSCYFFSFNQSECLTNSCQNQGKCLQDDERSNRLNSKCLCQSCFNGKLCQYSTSDYSLSLDVLISEDLNVFLGTTISKQSRIIQICFYLIILFVFIGLIFNLLTFILFSQKELRKTGSGIYLLILSLINQMNLILYLIQFLFLIQFPINLYLCKFLEYFVKLFPSISDWLATFITFEGAYSATVGLKFNKKKSKKFAKIIILILIVIQSIIYLHEIFFRKLIEDLLVYENKRQWCVITFDNFNWLKTYNIIINILNIILPFLCHFICALYILIKQSLLTLKLQERQKFLIILYNEFCKHKHLLISPIVLIVLNLPRLIFLFIFTCFNSSIEWQKYLLITIYFLSFMPRILTFFLFVLTSSFYKEQIKRILNKFRRYYHS